MANRTLLVASHAGYPTYSPYSTLLFPVNGLDLTPLLSFTVLCFHKLFPSLGFPPRAQYLGIWHQHILPGSQKLQNVRVVQPATKCIKHFFCRKIFLLYQTAACHTWSKCRIHAASSPPALETNHAQTNARKDSVREKTDSFQAQGTINTSYRTGIRQWKQSRWGVKVMSFNQPCLQHDRFYIFWTTKTPISRAKTRTRAEKW